MSADLSPTDLALPAAVLWDMDGTLVDTEPYWIAAEHAIVEAAGGVWSEDYALQLVGSDLTVSAEFIRAHSPVTWDNDRIIQELLARVVAGVREHAPWQPGARELLADLVAAGVPCALVTMSWRSLAEAVLGGLPENSFTVIITGDEVEHGKPHPEPYWTACRALGVEPADCVALEDSPTGVRSAVGAGVPTVAIPHAVDVPELAGAVRRESLAGVDAAELARLGQQARASLAEAPAT